VGPDYFVFGRMDGNAKRARKGEADENDDSGDLGLGIGLESRGRVGGARGGAPERGRIETRPDKGGEVVQGELIGVREETLVVLTKQGDRSVGIGEVETLLVKDLSGMLIGGTVGLTAGAGVDLALWHSFKKDTSGGGGEILRAFVTPGAILLTVLIAAGGTGAGMLIGHAAHNGKTYKVRGMTDQELRGLLETLRKKAMVPNYK
jgi:hypothetical protein